MPLAEDMDETSLNYMLMRTHVRKLDRLFPTDGRPVPVLIVRNTPLPKRNTYDLVFTMVAERRAARRRHNAGVACSIVICAIYAACVFNLVLADLGWILR